ncbi:RNA polymerase sigma factor [Pseudomonas sp. CCC3.1]|uniref:RNA polymerase sigma factor n=1 Tax=Pseudomonas sp. CCC3.1 TaxID=3048607 RepID=UPI002AC8E0DD|nr:RNA polymerase sigma factor [Pseudomonas sp. CCC3.1]MEB0207636.1 RNA polymerase sigma factor [Pseudomonas sp. CCC3.1]WPX36010.1 RNA polymerase sigma factor [Pseudomonas sp. CCC3.1]
MASEPDLERWYADYAPRLRRFVLLKTRQPELADDLTQECFARLATRDSEERLQEPMAFLFTMANRLVIDHRRSHQQARTESVPLDTLHEVVDPLPGPDVQAEAQQDMQRLLHALQALPLRTRQVFQLCRFEGMSYPQAAEHLAISTSSVQKHLAMALSFVAQKMERRG